MQPSFAEQSFLSAWREVLAECAEEALRSLQAVEGVVGLVLAGSMARDEQWPLSDIDIIPLYEDTHAEAAAREAEARRLDLVSRWGVDELDVGKLAFRRSEVEVAVSLPPADASGYLDDLRWFHSLDKGYGGRAIFDPEGLARSLAGWLTEARFTPEVVQARIDRHRQ